MGLHRNILRCPRLFYARTQFILLRRQPLEFRLRHPHVAPLTATQALTALPRTNVDLAHTIVLNTGRTLLNHSFAKRFDKFV